AEYRSTIRQGCDAGALVASPAGSCSNEVVTHDYVVDYRVSRWANHLGNTIHQFVIEQRICHAHSLLRDGEMTECPREWADEGNAFDQIPGVKNGRSRDRPK